MSGAAADDELRSLYEWLRAEPSVHRNAEVTLQSAAPRPGEMGAVLEAIQVVTDSGFNTAELVLAYLTWRMTRTEKPDVTIQRGDVKISLSNASPEKVKEITESLDNDQP
ncbi:effector-associated constant component EACC1 [Actinomadura kijaniata]|uniref:effector-associated constant component EACC1 n=1 Tax=Actinomadura kijaniata TaxID=46161 RepID=UPI003F1D3AD9